MRNCAKDLGRIILGRTIRLWPCVLLVCCLCSTALRASEDERKKLCSTYYFDGDQTTWILVIRKDKSYVLFTPDDKKFTGRAGFSSRELALFLDKRRRHFSYKVDDSGDMQLKVHEKDQPDVGEPLKSLPPKPGADKWLKWIHADNWKARGHDITLPEGILAEEVAKVESKKPKPAEKKLESVDQPVPKVTTSPFDVAAHPKKVKGDFEGRTTDKRPYTIMFLDDGTFEYHSPMAKRTIGTYRYQAGLLTLETGFHRRILALADTEQGVWVARMPDDKLSTEDPLGKMRPQGASAEFWKRPGREWPAKWPSLPLAKGQTIVQAPVEVPMNEGDAGTKEVDDAGDDPQPIESPAVAEADDLKPMARPEKAPAVVPPDEKPVSNKPVAQRPEVKKPAPKPPVQVAEVPDKSKPVVKPEPEKIVQTPEPPKPQPVPEKKREVEVPDVAQTNPKIVPEKKPVPPTTEKPVVAQKPEKPSLPPLPEPEPEAVAQATPPEKPAPKPETVEAKPVPVAKPKPEPKVEAKPKPNPAPKPETVEAKPVPVAKPKPVSKVEPEKVVVETPAPKQKPEPAAKPVAPPKELSKDEPKPKSKTLNDNPFAQTEPETEPRKVAEATPESNPQLKPQSQPKAEAEASQAAVLPIKIVQEDYWSVEEGDLAPPDASGKPVAKTSPARLIKNDPAGAKPVAQKPLAPPPVQVKSMDQIVGRYRYRPNPLVTETLILTANGKFAYNDTNGAIASGTAELAGSVLTLRSGEVVRVFNVLRYEDGSVGLSRGSEDKPRILNDLASMSPSVKKSARFHKR